MVSFRWLRPGLHIKRWVFAICVGMILLIVGGIFLALGVLGTRSIPLDFLDTTVSSYGVARLLIPAGSLLTLAGVYRLVRRIEKLLRRADESRGLAEIAFQTRRLDQGPRIVCFGGGTGLSTMLSGLRERSGRITAIVSVADDGGSSGRLRHDFDMLPPGDIRNCLAALSDAGEAMRNLMQYRFDEGELAGHSFGNLFIAVLARLNDGDFGAAVREANRLLNVRGRVLPATLDKVSLVATHPDGSKTTGQRHIALCAKPIVGLELKPRPGEVQADVLAAVAEADLIVLGPGSLYTSVLPNLLDDSVVAAIGHSRARVAFVVNTVDQPGETPGFTVSRHIRTLLEHAPELRIDTAIVNNAVPSPAQLARLTEKGQNPTVFDARETNALGLRILLRDIMNRDTPAKHDPTKLADALMDVF